MSEQSNGVRYKNSGNYSLPVWFQTFPFTFRMKWLSEDPREKILFYGKVHLAMWT